MAEERIKNIEIEVIIEKGVIEKIRVVRIIGPKKGDTLLQYLFLHLIANMRLKIGH